MNWAIFGASTIAREFVIPAIRANRGSARWIVSSDISHAESFKLECSVEKATVNLAEALSDPCVKAVYIGSANSKHYEQVIAAAAAGKHVLCEKPLATSSTHARALVKVCEDQGVVFAVNHHLRAYDVHRKMRDLIGSGLIGDVRSIMILSAWSLRPSLQTWRIQSAEEGAIYFDISTHTFDLARFLLQQEAINVTAMGAGLALGNSSIHDHTMYCANLSGGAFLQSHESFITPSATSRVTVLGSKGSLWSEGTLVQRPGGRLFHGSEQGNNELQFYLNDPYVETVRAFLDAIENGTRPLATGRDGWASLAAAEAVRESATSRRIVHINQAFE